MKSVIKRLLPLPIQLLLILFLPADTLAALARASMEVKVQVVRGDYAKAAAELIEKVESRGLAKSPINSDADCEAIGSMGSVDGVSATCSWDPLSHLYLLTVQY